MRTLPGEGAPGAVLREIEVPVRDLARFEPLVGPGRYDELCAAAARARKVLAGVRVWQVNSTATGGGVAEMLHVLVGYGKGAGVDTRWLVLGGDPAFFAVTKRIHNRLHGAAGDGGALDEAERGHYEAVLAATGEQLTRYVGPADVVVLHDPQTLGLAPALAARGRRVVWRCHVGTDTANPATAEAWAFLGPYLASCDAFVFSRASYAPAAVRGDRLWVIPPSIDPLSAKNRELPARDAAAVLRRIGLHDGPAPERAAFTRGDGSAAEVGRRATVLGGEPLPAGVPLVVQVSRWDHLKDMAGVLAGFAAGVVGRTEAALALVGPAVGEVADDPESAAVLGECTAAWRALPAAARARIRLVSLPMDDVEENAAMVNAVQRGAAVVVQKSLAEGFGLTVAEAMWKARPVVASAVGGIVDQVVPGTGILLDDPADLDGFAAAVAGVLGTPDRGAAMGRRAHDHVRVGFLGDRHLMQYARLLETLVGS